MMLFKAGHYDFIVRTECLERFEVVANELALKGITRAQFIAALRKVRAEVQLGRAAGDMTPTGRADEWGVPIHGYRVHFHVDRLLMTISIVDLEDLPPAA